MTISHHVSYYLDLILKQMEGVRVMVDATLGNGHDALKLKRFFPESMLYGFDVQRTALEASARRLNQEGITTGYEFHQASHADIGELVREPIDLCLFNLGYMPGGDKALHTTSETTYKAVTAVLEKLSPEGLLVLTLYPGSIRGRIETIQLENRFESLEQKAVTVLRLKPVNQKNNPPYMILIQKNRG